MRTQKLASQFLRVAAEREFAPAQQGAKIPHPHQRIQRSYRTAAGNRAQENDRCPANGMRMKRANSQHGENFAAACDGGRPRLCEERRRIPASSTKWSRSATTVARTAASDSSKEYTTPVPENMCQWLYTRSGCGGAQHVRTQGATARCRVRTKQLSTTFLNRRSASRTTTQKAAPKGRPRARRKGTPHAKRGWRAVASAGTAVRAVDAVQAGRQTIDRQS